MDLRWSGGRWISVNAASELTWYTPESMAELRLGDVIDDFCVKCKRLTNHSIVSLVHDEPAKVRCRTCYSDHDYRHEQAPPSKKDLKKAELFKEVLGSVSPDSAPSEQAELESDSEAVEESEPVKPRKTRAKKA
jgi:hypothetical protein